MDFDVKKLVRGAGTAISRVVQLTEEKLGTAEKTVLDPHFEQLAERSDISKSFTEKIVRNLESVLTPNPGNRMEDFLFEKIDKRKPTRLSNLEYLGIDMIEAGNEFGPGTSYGNALVKVGQCEQRLGAIEREFINAANHTFVAPLHKFLEGEMKTISKERSILESKRLDLDACKNRVKKARSMLGGPPNKDGITPERMLQEAEQELRMAQSEFDRQVEITKLLLESVNSSHTSHLQCLTDFVEVQAKYFAQCHARMQELQSELNSLGDSEETLIFHSGKKRARVLCDYDAQNQGELSLMAGEIINVEMGHVLNSSHLIVERGKQRGKIPKSCVEFL